MTEDDFNQHLIGIRLAQEEQTKVITLSLQLVVQAIHEANDHMETHNQIMEQLNLNMAVLARAAQGI